LGSSSRTAKRLVRTLLACLAAAGAVGLGLGVPGVPGARADDVRIDLSTDQTRRVAIQLEALEAAGDRAGSTQAAQSADLILAADLSGSGVFDVAREGGRTTTSRPRASRPMSADA